MSSAEVSNAVVVGAGYVGAALVASLRADGVHTWSVRRSAGVDDGEPEHAIRLDVADAAAVSTALAHLSGATLFYLVGAGSYDDDTYRRVYVEGLTNVLAVGWRRVLFASSTAVYGQEDGSWVDESSVTAPRGFSGARMLQAETLLAGHDAAAVRFGGIYGPTRTRLIDNIQKGVSIAPAASPGGSVGRWQNRIHRDDCAAALQHLAGIDDLESVYVAVDDEPSDPLSVQRWLCDQLGSDPESLSAPEGRFRHGGNKRCRNGRLKASGFRFRYPTYREGYGALLDLRNTGSASG